MDAFYTLLVFKFVCMVYSFSSSFKFVRFKFTYRVKDMHILPALNSRRHFLFDLNLKITSHYF